MTIFQILILSDYLLFDGPLFKNGSYQVLEWAVKEIEGMPDYIQLAASLGVSRSGHLDLLKKLKLDKNHLGICANAAASGNLEMLQWLLDTGCPWDYLTCAKAAKYGHLHVLEWAIDNGCEWNITTPASAALGGYLEILEYLWKFFQKQCVEMWDEDNSVTVSAATAGNLESLKWALSHQCFSDQATFSAAIESGNTEIFKWLVAQKRLYDEVECMYIAVELGNLEIMKLLKENGCKFNEFFLASAEKARQLNALKWLKEEYQLE